MKKYSEMQSKAQFSLYMSSFMRNMQQEYVKNTKNKIFVSGSLKLLDGFQIKSLELQLVNS